MAVESCLNFRDPGDQALRSLIQLNEPLFEGPRLLDHRIRGLPCCARRARVRRCSPRRLGLHEKLQVIELLVEGDNARVQLDHRLVDVMPELRVLCDVLRVGQLNELLDALRHARDGRERIIETGYF